MAYNSSTGIISGSVSHSDINAALGTSYGTNRELCTSGAIKPLAKYKPVTNSSNGPLTEDQRRGTGENGIFYGLKAGMGSANNLYYAHNADWSYAGRPTGGIGLSPYRLQDFNGYNKNATPVFWGEGISSGATVQYSSPNITATLWHSDNAYGVDITEMINGALAKGSTYWANMSVYIVIDNYATMMTPNRVWYNSALQKNFKCPALPSALQNTATRKVTIVVGPYDSSMDGSWVAFNSDSVLGGNKFVSLYGLINMSINFASSAIIIVTNFYGTVSGSNINYSWEIGTNWNDYAYKRLYITVVQTNTGSPGDGLSYTVNMSGTSASVSYEEVVRHYGFLEYPGSGNTYEITAMVQYSSNGSSWNSSSVTRNTVTF